MWPGPNDPPISVNSEFLKEKLLAAREKFSSRERVEPRPVPCEDPAEGARGLAAAPDANPTPLGFPVSSGSRSQVPKPCFQDAEAMAKFLTERPDCLTAEAIVDLVSLLPEHAKDPLRKFQEESDGRYSMGVYKHGGILGIHKNSRLFPLTCKAVNMLVGRVCPTFSYSSLAVHVDVKSGLHRDVNNRPGPNLIVPLSYFSGGELWNEKRGGTFCAEGDPELMGELIDVAAGPAFLPDPTAFHETRSWTGRRIILIAYSVLGCEHLAVASRPVVETLGFSVAPLGLGPFAVSGDPRSRPLAPVAAEASLERFVPKDASEMYFIEVCAGSAELSRAAARLGFRPFAVGAPSRRLARAQVVVMDLADSMQLEAFLEFVRVEFHHIVCVFISPPSGTSSLMRERPPVVSYKPTLQLPRPLRSARFPDGLPGLSGRDKVCLERANQLFESLAVVAKEALALGVLTVIENPANSRYWETSFFAQVASECPGHSVLFHSCVHGGLRPKLCRLWSSADVFGSLEGRCDGSHRHVPWRPVLSRKRRVSCATVDEPLLPPLLVERLLHCVVQACPELQFGPQNLSQAAASASLPMSKLNLGLQPRGNRLPQLVWEFDRTLDCIVPVQQTRPLERLIADLPKGSRVFSRQVCQWGSLKSLLDRVTEPGPRVCGLDVERPPPVAELVQIGVPCAAAVFVQRAAAAGHPRSLARHVESFVTECARSNFEAPPAELASFRIDALKFWIGRAASLKEDEQRLHESLPDHLKLILQGKKLLLLKEMMRAAGCADETLVDDICRGFSLSGWLPASGEFLPRSRRPKFSVQTLGVLAKGFNKVTLQKLSRRQEETLESATWAETQKEIDDGWVWVDSEPLAENLAVAMRFGIMQNKLRVIDDLSCCGLNATVGLVEKFSLHTIDKLAAMMAHAFDVNKAGMPECCGRTFDLKAAYKQFGVCLEDRARFRIAVNKPHSLRPVFLGVNALPFGGVGSVAGFLRVSAALWKIGVVLLRLFWTAYFDDFSVVSAKQLCSNTHWVVETLFDLLGFRFAREGSKASPFATAFEMLGLRVDLSRVQERILTVGHTEKRKAELHGYIQEVLTAGCIEPKAAERLRGRMVFFEGFSFGRVSNRAQRIIGRCAEGSESAFLSADLKWALNWLDFRVCHSEPLTIERNLITTVLIFTDGACDPEEGTGGVGGVLVNASGLACEFFGEAVPASLMQKLFNSSENPIFELELIPLLICLKLWASHLKGSQVVFYLDNDGARHSLIRTYGGGVLAENVIEAFLQLEASLELKAWFARVPTSCNIADDPSRLKHEPLLKMGAAKRAVPWDLITP